MFEAVKACFDEFEPDIVFHLAAQALVRRSYRDPVATFASNVMGTVHVLECARQTRSIRAIVCVTSDKVYENRDWVWGYRETDRLGGRDPYSGSKACAEHVANVYRALMSTADTPVVATARGGNVVGGGDWAEDRIVPDIVRAILQNRPVVLRNPLATRPWQHVLELCRGYLHLGVVALETPARAAGAWNFGPELDHDVNVEQVASDIYSAWGLRVPAFQRERSLLKESRALHLDSSKARQILGWKPAVSYEETVERTARWYRRFHASNEAAHALVAEELSSYIDQCAG
jgi:CDP-glucose 4,6-dehydratase